MEQTDNIKAEYVLEFSSDLLSEEIFNGLMTLYPDELLGLKLKQIREGKYEFKEYINKFENFTSFISFEFLKMICEEKMGFTFHTLKFTKDQETQNLQNPKFILAKEQKPNDFYETFLKQWESFIIQRKMLGSSKNKDKNRQKYNHKLEVLSSEKPSECLIIFKHKKPASQIESLIKEYYSGITIEYKKPFMQFIDTTESCVGINSFKTHKLLRLIAENLCGFKFHAMSITNSEQKRKKWVTKYVDQLFDSEPDYDDFVKEVAEKLNEEISTSSEQPRKTTFSTSVITDALPIKIPESNNATVTSSKLTLDLADIVDTSKLISEEAIIILPPKIKNTNILYKTR